MFMSHDPRCYLRVACIARIACSVGIVAWYAVRACHTRSSTKRSQIAQRKSHWQRDMTSSMKEESAKRSSGLGVMPGDPISLGISVAYSSCSVVSGVGLRVCADERGRA